MRKYLVWKDGHSRELTPITYQEFMALNLWIGSSDLAWNQWLYKNGFSEADSFNDQALDEAEFLLKDDPVGLDNLYFLVNEDGETWETYNALKARNFTNVGRLFNETTRCHFLKPDYIKPEDR